MFLFLKLVALCLLSTITTGHVITKRQSALPYGMVLYSCTQPNTIALTFDDGPYIYTDTVLDKLKAAGQRATFFLNGNNPSFGYIYNFNSTVARYMAEGHQVASHT